MDLGTTIRKLRREKDLTQEQLAEYLSVSVSAVSQWESGKTSPDLSMIVPLANFFEVSIDVLFDRGTEAREKEKEEYRNRSQECAKRGDISGKIAVWREAVRNYPGDFECIAGLADALAESANCGGEPEVLETAAREAIALYDRVLRDCTDGCLRNRAVSELVYLYSDRDFSFADEEKAVQYARMAGKFDESSEILLARAYFTDENRDLRTKQRHLNNLNFMDLLCMNLYYQHGETPEERISACETAAKLWNTLIPDGNFLFFHCRLQRLYQILARSHAELGHKAETVTAIRMALHHADAFDRQPSGEQHYTSPFVCAAAENIEGYTKNYEETNTAVVRRWMKSSIFDFIREEPEFKKF